MKKWLHELRLWAIQRQVALEGDTWNGRFFGLECRLFRHSIGGHWMGVVQVPEYHKWFKKDPQTCLKWPQCIPESIDMDKDEMPPVPVLPYYWTCNHRLITELKDVVHGGLALVGHMKDTGDIWWLGFTCGHPIDLAPRAWQGKFKKLFINIASDGYFPPYRSKKFALKELEKLARVIKNTGANA